MDRERFFRALATVTGRDGADAGIGTLGEKALHATLKLYLDENPSHHEIRVRGFFADVQNGEGIFEIQTRGFDRLRRKLAAFLDISPVTVVYPIARTRRLIWIDPEDGTLSPRRKSPKTGRLTDVAPELYRIRPFLAHPNFRLRLVLLDCDEFKRKGRNGSTRYGAERFERIPYDLVDDQVFCAPLDYLRLLPQGLPTVFGSAEVARLGRLSRSRAATLLLLLTDLAVVSRIGKKGNAFLYTIAEDGGSGEKRTLP